MGIFEAANARRDAWVVQRQATIEEARRVWVGCTVAFYDAMLTGIHPWLAVNGEGLIYGEVTEIDDRGTATIVYAYTPDGKPMWRKPFFTDLGVHYWLVDA